MQVRQGRSGTEVFYIYCMREEGRATRERKRVGRKNVKWLLCFLTFSWNKYLHSIAEKEIDTKEKV